MVNSVIMYNFEEKGGKQMKKYIKPELKKIDLLKNLHGLALSCCSKKTTSLY